VILKLNWGCIALSQFGLSKHTCEGWVCSSITISGGNSCAGMLGFDNGVKFNCDLRSEYENGGDEVENPPAPRKNTVIL
jgi:hypothetical protein